MRTYEVLFILSPQVPEEEATALTTEFKRVGESTGAMLKNEEAWGRRRLAYPINKANEGIYHLLVYESDNSLAELDRRMRNSDRVLRHMIVRTDLDQKRADKLAKRNPKKERLRTAPASPGAPMSAAAPVGAAPAPPAPAPQPAEAAPAEPAAPVEAAPVEATPAEAAPAEATPAEPAVDETPQV